MFPVFNLLLFRCAAVPSFCGYSKLREMVIFYCPTCGWDIDFMMWCPPLEYTPVKKTNSWQRFIEIDPFRMATLYAFKFLNHTEPCRTEPDPLIKNLEWKQLLAGSWKGRSSFPVGVVVAIVVVVVGRTDVNGTVEISKPSGTGKFSSVIIMEFALGRDRRVQMLPVPEFGTDRRSIVLLLCFASCLVMYINTP